MQGMTSSDYTPRLLLDAVVLGFLGILIGLALLFPSRVQEWGTAVASLAAAGFLYVVTSRVVLRVPGLLRTMTYTLVVLLLSSFLFSVVSGFQHVFINSWFDEQVLSCEYFITGTESTLFLQNFITPLLTEWMMCAYVLYVPLLPVTALVCYFADGRRAAIIFLMNISVSNVLCYLGFILFPIAGPLWHFPEQYSVPLQGGFFALCGEWIRNNVHYPGGSLPSPHCAATTVMMAMLYRYNRRLWALFFPLLITIYVATVYGRYHYAMDSIAGILVGILVLKSSPRLVRLVDQRAVRGRRSGFLREVLFPANPRKEGAS